MASTTMSARQRHAAEYVAARELNADCVMIQNLPYCPTLAIDDPSDLSQVRTVVATLLSHGTDPTIAMDTSTYETWPVTPITGGITNMLFRVDITTTTISILVRLFGAVGLIDRDDETASFALLAASGMAPLYYGRFQNGRLEGWMHNMQALGVRQLGVPDIAAEIARQLARLHHADCFASDDHAGPTLWLQLDAWCRQAQQQAVFLTDQDTSRARQLQLSQYSSELTWLRRLIESLASPPAITYCHNDLLAANVLFDKTTLRIQLIDFEYGGFNYAAFDIANHWNEYAGGTEPGTLPNYDWLPTLPAQRAFLHAYLTQVSECIKHVVHENGNGTAVVTDQQIDDLLKHVHLFQMANHLYWGLWAVNQAAAEGCQTFDYLLYATKRLERYHYCRQESR